MKGLAQRRYTAALKARERWIHWHDKEPWSFTSWDGLPRERHYPVSPHIYHKWHGGCGCHCACGSIKKWYKKFTNRNLRNYSGELPSGGFYKRFEDPWNWD